MGDNMSDTAGDTNEIIQPVRVFETNEGVCHANILDL